MIPDICFARMLPAGYPMTEAFPLSFSITPVNMRMVVGLTSAIRTEKAKKIALPYIEANIVHRGYLLVTLGQPVHLYG